MLELVVNGREWFNESLNEFVISPSCHLTLEHSLLSVSKWESKWKIPFLDEKVPKTRGQSVDYIRCMTIGKQPDLFVYYNIPMEQIDMINRYIGDNQTATFITRTETPRPTKREPITSELIYYWMTLYNIPFECQKWHLSRLLTLIDVCAFKNEPPKKMSASDLAKRNRTLNNARRAKHHTKG